MLSADTASLIQKWSLRLAVAAALFCGIGVRVWNISGEPLWLDEGYSAYAASKGFDFLWQIVPRYETHTPFYYSFLRIWTLIFGDNILALRSLGLAAGLLTLGVVAATAREAGRQARLDSTTYTIWIGLAVSFAAVSHWLVEMTREVRPYPLMILVYSVAVTAIVRQSRRVAAGRGIGGASFLAYLAMASLTLWLHNLGSLYVAAMGCAFLMLCSPQSWTRRDWAILVGGHLAVLLIWIPALMILADQAPTWIKSTWLRSPSWAMWNPITLMFVVPLPPSIVAGLCLVGLLVHCWKRNPDARRMILALAILALLPLALSLIISILIAPVFIPRTMTPIIVPSILLLALGAATATRRMRMLGLAAMAVIAVQMAIIDIRQRNDVQEDWYALLDWLEPRFRQGDVVFAYPNEGALAFRFAQRDKKLHIATQPIPTDVPTLDGGPGAWNPTGSRGVFSLPKERLEAIASAPSTKRIPTIWLLRQGAWAYDKGDNFLHALERDRTRVGRIFIFPIEIIGLRRKDLPPVAAPEQAKP